MLYTIFLGLRADSPFFLRNAISVHHTAKHIRNRSVYTKTYHPTKHIGNEYKPPLIKDISKDFV